MDTQKYIITKIRDGSYYQEALEWYMRCYILPISERTFAAVIAILFLFLLGMSVLNIQSLIDKTTVSPVTIYVDNSTDNFSVIKPLAKEDETTQQALARYLVVDYIKAREEYLYKKMNTPHLKYLLKKIKGSSASNVLNEYKNYMDDTNIYSPVMRYKNHTNRYIKIKSFKFHGNDSILTQAKVIFEATTYNKHDKTTKNRLWEATVHFRLPEIATIASTGAPFRFLVKYYKAKPIKKS